MGQYGGKDDVNVRRKWTSDFPCHESIVKGSAQKHRRWEVVDSLCADLDMIKTYRTIFLLISSVFTEQLQKCVKDMNSSMIGQGNRFGRAVEFLIRVKRHQDRSAFGL